jgi:hypothetical protein
MEAKVLLVEKYGGVIVVGPRLFEFGDGGIGSRDVGGVMLAVVQLVDLA